MSVHGVAVAIPEPYAAVLQEARERAGDPLARSIPPHVTLLPPTDIPESDLADFTRHLGLVAASHAPFTMHLRGTGTFRPVSPVVFIQIARGIADCEIMQEWVRSGSVERALEFPYHPHVTIAHGVGEDELDGAFDELAHFEASFAVEAIHLYDHADDGVWRPCQSFTLTGTAPTGP